MNIFIKRLLLAITGWFIFYIFEVKVFDLQSVSNSVLSQRFFCWIYFMVLAMIFYPKTKGINIDFSGTFRHREIGFIEDVSRELIFTRNGIIALILAIFIGKWSVQINNYLKNENNQTQSSRTNIQQQENVSQSQNSYSQNNGSNSGNTNSNVTVEKRDEDWYPNKEYYSTVTWDNLIVRDEYSINASLPKGINYVDIVGNFVSSYKSDNYYPHVYVDGYEGNNDFFSKFFRVSINKITLKNGETISGSDVELSVYLKTIKSGESLSEDCYRDIRIYLKKQFKNKIRWHIVDAGQGVNEAFKLSTVGNQYMTSLYDSKKFNIPMFDVHKN